MFTFSTDWQFFINQLSDNDYLLLVELWSQHYAWHPITIGIVWVVLHFLQVMQIIYKSTQTKYPIFNCFMVAYNLKYSFIFRCSSMSLTAIGTHHCLRPNFIKTVFLRVLMSGPHCWKWQLQMLTKTCLFIPSHSLVTLIPVWNCFLSYQKRVSEPVEGNNLIIVMR